MTLLHKGRVLVTGGAGLIGSHLTDLLIQTGYDVTVLDFLEPQTHPNGKPAWVNPKARFIHGNILNEQDLKNTLQGVNFVFHQSAFVGFTEENSKYFEVNGCGTAQLFECIFKYKLPVQKVVVASSQAVYGEGAYICKKDGLQFPPVRSLEALKKKHWELTCEKCGYPLGPAFTSEEKRRDGESPYALSKELEERLALFCGKKFGVAVTALRYGVTYGPRQSVFNPYTGVVSIFSTRLLNDLAPLIYEDGNQSRDFVYVKDIARANLFAAEHPSTDGQVFNVGTGKPTEIAGLARILAGIYKKPIEPEICGKFRHGDVRHLVLDPSKLKKLGFTIETSLSEGLSHFAEWMESQGKVEDVFSKAYEKLKQNRVVCD